MSLSPPTRLGAYEILSAIGAGGMGEVYRARDSNLGRTVAIKVLPASVANDPERIVRFEREARLLASLNHPNIATLYGLESCEGIRFLVMELIEGETLAERIREGLAIQEILPIFRQIAEALEAAHERGIIHRDLKPANVMIAPDGRVKVLDFGLAKVFGPELASRPDASSPTVTREGTETGIILGTAAYMSPEQARGKALDKRTDIWSFGCCLFEALSREAAFLGPTISDTIAAILEREPDWNALPARTPPGVRRILTRCLTKEPWNRLRDIGDARIELAPADEERTRSTQLAPTPSRWVLFTAVGLAVLFAAISLWNLFHLRESPAEEVVRSILPLPEVEPLAVWTVAPSLAVSPDGSHVAYVAGTVDRRRLYLRRLDQLEARVVDGSEGAAAPFFSPDGQWVGFWKRSGLMRAAVSGGGPQRIASLGENLYGVDWGPDAIVTSMGDHLSQLQLDRDEPEVLTTADPGRREVWHRFPQLLPDGKSVLFTVVTSTHESWNDGLIAVASVETGEHRIVMQGGSQARYSPTGHLVYVHHGTLYAVGFDLENLQVLREPVPMVEQVMTAEAGGVGEFDLADDGTLVYAPGRSRFGDRRVVWVDREGRVEPLLDVPRRYIRPRVSPDGSRIALAVQTPLSSIWLHDVERGTLTRWTSEWINTAPVWSPDGRDLAFFSLREGHGGLYRNPFDSRAPAQQLAVSGTLAAPTSWSPDGTTLALQRPSNETGNDVWLLSLEGGREPEPFLVGPANEEMARFSPDGRWIAYQSDETGQFEVFVCRFPEGSGRMQVSIEGGYEPVWNPNGKELFYRSGNRMMAVALDGGSKLVLGRPAVLFEGRYASHPNGSYDVTPDGHLFVLIDESEAESAPAHLVLVQNFSEELNRLVPTNSTEHEFSLFPD